MSDLPAETLDRLLAGELPPSEERRIAQLALEDPELFELLTAAAIVRNNRPPVGGSLWARRPGVIAVTMLAAAALVMLAVAFGPSRFVQRPAAVRNTTAGPTAAAAIPQPILLIARIDAAAQPTFRTDAGTSRLPRQAGTIVSVHDGDIEVDLGSLDGVTRGMELRVVGDSGDARTGGPLTIRAVFRERSRGRITAGAGVRPGDRVDVGPTVHVSAILAAAEARRAAGDLAGARTLARLAVSEARTANVAPDVRRRSLDQLARLERHGGDAIEAGRLLAAASDDFDAAPAASPAERADVLNELGAIRIEQQDYAAAERALRAAQPYALGVVKMRVTNNLGAVAALRGDTAAAATLYRQALSLAGASTELAADRHAIEQNLDGLKTSR